MNSPIEVLEALRELVALKDAPDASREAAAWARARELARVLPGTVSLTILGQPASKANSRQIGLIGKGDKRRPMVRKSDAALAYEDGALRQVPSKARVRMTGPVRVTMRVFYASELPDLDESVILDVLQDRAKRDKTTGERYLLHAGVYRNDRQVRQKVVVHHVDKDNPRAEIVVEPLTPQNLEVSS